MSDESLRQFWISLPSRSGPLGFGITAFSLTEALELLRAMDYGTYLPEDLTTLVATEGVDVAELNPHVRAHMGPISMRGMWYPFGGVGVPKWVNERLARPD